MYVKTVRKKLKSGRQKIYYYFAEKIEGREKIVRSITENNTLNAHLKAKRIYLKLDLDSLESGQTDY